MTTRICLVRHGITDWNQQERMQGQTDVPLNAEGRRQAHLAGKALARGSWTALYSSDLSRARETACIIGRYVGLPVLLEAGLRERVAGAIEGLTLHEIRGRFPGYPQIQEGIPGLESRAALQERILAVLEELAASHPGGRIIAVSHGAAIRAAVRGLGEPCEGGAPIANAGLHTLEKDGGVWRILEVNATAHLQEGAPRQEKELGRRS